MTHPTTSSGPFQPSTPPQAVPLPPPLSRSPRSSGTNGEIMHTGSPNDTTFTLVSSDLESTAIMVDGQNCYQDTKVAGQGQDGNTSVARQLLLEAGSDGAEGTTDDGSGDESESSSSSIRSVSSTQSEALDSTKSMDGSVNKNFISTASAIILVAAFMYCNSPSKKTAKKIPQQKFGTGHIW